MLKSIAIGTYDFKKLIESNSYYVDKTDIIEELIKNRKEVYLFPRPRRFGKSLFISMLDNFFNIEFKDTNKNLFDGLNITKSEYYEELSTRPVINIDFSTLQSNSYEGFYQMYKTIIYNLYVSKGYLYKNLSEIEKKLYNKFIDKTADESEYKLAIQYLSQMMYNYYHKKVVILMDEYDVPIQDGYLNNYYDDVMDFIKIVFLSTYKKNPYLDFGVITGVLRVSGESLFSTFNNPDVYSIMDNRYNEYFGFTNEETKELLEYYGLELIDDVKDMYDGYNFGGIEIYNPWSILKYADRRVLEPFWLNTTSNKLVFEIIRNCQENIKIIIEKLLLGKKIEFIYNDKTTYQDYNDLSSVDDILNLLLASGYLTVDQYIDSLGQMVKTVKIPNKEVKSLFSEIILKILKDDYDLDITKAKEFCLSILNNNKETMEKMLNDMLVSKSYMDTEEAYYHGYLNGVFVLLINNNKYIVDSNREAGNGRFDLMIKDKEFNKGIIIEIKVTKDDLEESAVKALNQIEEKKYYLDLLHEGYKDIRKIAIVFKDKECIVR